jgi:hypothetical protein
MGSRRYRTIWLSDIHLGTRECRAQALLDFLDAHDCEYLYLVGDIIDFRFRPYSLSQLHAAVSACGLVEIRTVPLRSRAILARRP